MEMSTAGGYSYVIWDGTQQKIVIAIKSIKGKIEEGAVAKAKWKGVMHSVAIVKSGKIFILLFLNYNC